MVVWTNFEVFKIMTIIDDFWFEWADENYIIFTVDRCSNILPGLDGRFSLFFSKSTFEFKNFWAVLRKMTASAIYRHSSRYVHVIVAVCYAFKDKPAFNFSIFFRIIWLGFSKSNKPIHSFLKIMSDDWFVNDKRT